MVVRYINLSRLSKMVFYGCSEQVLLNILIEPCIRKRIFRKMSQLNKLNAINSNYNMNATKFNIYNKTQKYKTDCFRNRQLPTTQTKQQQKIKFRNIRKTKRLKLI